MMQSLLVYARCLSSVVTLSASLILISRFAASCNKLKKFIYIYVHVCTYLFSKSYRAGIDSAANDHEREKVTNKPRHATSRKS